jgi:hypothetical protein
MKKNTAVFNIIITSLALSYLTSGVALSETSSAGETTAADKTTLQDRSSDYVIPRPQADRISALETSLITRRLGHQIQTLEANSEPFLSLYKSSLTDSTQGCVILLHSDNEHPDWPDAIAPLRNALPEHSWCTLSIEVPDIIKRGEAIKTQTTNTEETNNQQAFQLPNQTMVFARIQAVISKAQSDDISQFVFLGYKTGAAYALSFLANNPTSGEALALIDIETPAGISHYNLAQQIRRIPQPILDYYVNTNAGSHQFATWRKQAANQRTEVIGDYIQLDAIPDRATGKKSKQLLIQRVRGFLKQNTSQIDQLKTLPNIKKGLFYKSP